MYITHNNFLHGNFLLNKRECKIVKYSIYTSRCYNILYLYNRLGSCVGSVRKYNSLLLSLYMQTGILIDDIYTIPAARVPVQYIIYK